MAGADESLLDLEVSNTFSNSDLLIIVRDPLGDPTTNTITAQTFVEVMANNYLIASQTPANSTITIGQGMILYDNSYIYVAVSNNVLKRAALSTF